MKPISEMSHEEKKDYKNKLQAFIDRYDALVRLYENKDFLLVHDIENREATILATVSLLANAIGEERERVLKTLDYLSMQEKAFAHILRAGEGAKRDLEAFTEADRG